MCVCTHTEAACKIIRNLRTYQQEYQSGKYQIDEKGEDVHLNIEARLIKDLGF